MLQKKKKAEHINITIQPDILEEFRKYAERKGIMVSPFVAAKMKEFIEEEQLLEEMKKNKSFGHP